MADRSIRILLTADARGLVSGLKTASQATKDYGNRLSDFVSRNEQNISHLSNVLGGMGLALTAGFGFAVKTFADFDAAMSSVAAATMTTGAELESLRQAAIDAGAATSFSATEAAGAIENLAKAGISTTDILNGGLTGALDLAAAGELDVADAAEIAATAMTQFGLSGEDVTHIADLLAAGAGKAQGDVTDMGEALKQAGLVSSQFGLSIEETTGSLAAFASAGLLGSDAGTSLRTMLLRLGNPSKEAADEMARLGISAYDAQDNFVGMTDLAGQLERALSPLPQAQRDAALATIFGSDAIRAANVLYQQGAAGIEGWITAVDDQGYAAEQAAMRLDNLKGDLESLGGAFESLILESGSGANDFLRSLVQGAEGVVDAFRRIPEPVLNATTLIVGGGGLVALGLAGLGKLAIGINNVKGALAAMNVSMKTAGITAGALGGAIGVAAIGLTVWADSAARAEATVATLESSLDEATGAITRNTREVIANELTTQQGWWLFKKDSGADAARTLGVSIDTVTDAVLGNADALREVDEATRGWDGSTQSLIDAASAAGVEADDYANAQRTLREEVDRLTGRLAEAEEKNRDVAAATGVAKTAQEEAVVAYSGATDEIVTQDGALQSLIETQAEAAGVVLTEREAQRQLEESYGGVSRAIEEQITQLASQYEAQGMGTEAARRRAEEEVNAANKFDITTEAGRRNQAALDDIATSTWDVIDAMQRNGADQKTLQGVMQTSRDRFIGVATAAGMSADEANALVDELGLIPAQVQTDIVANTGPAMQNIENLKAAMASIKDRTVQITTAFQETGIRPPAGFYVPGNAEGGWIHGPGTGTSDSILRRLSNGEFVVNAKDAQENAGLLEAINSGKFSGNTSVRTAPASVSSTTTHNSNRTLAPVVNNYGAPLTERRVLNALHQADLLDPHR